MLLLAAVLGLAGLAIATVGFLGLRERLPRNRFAGVRTAATLRDAETFRLANKIAGPATVAGGLVGVVTGLASYLGGGLVVGGIGLAGLVAITAGAGLLGHRAALAMPEPRAEAPDGCGTCAGRACGSCVLRPRTANS